jgi:flagellar hook-basal body complex protein FliE
MSAPISAIRPPSLPDPLSTSGQSAGGSAGGNDFQNILRSAIGHVEASSAKADAAVQDYLSGANQELHSTILATQSAGLDFEMFLQVRNKVVSAYEEIMRMQV